MIERNSQESFTDYLHFLDDQLNDIMNLGYQWFIENDYLDKEDLIERYKKHKEENSSIKDQAYDIIDNQFHKYG